MSYIPLWCKSNFSFLEAASHPEELVERAHQLGLKAVALTDRDGVYGIVRAHQKAKELGLKLIIGAQVTIDDGSVMVLLVQDRTGYANLCRLLSKGRLRCPKGQSQVRWSEVAEHAPGLLALWGGPQSALVAEGDEQRLSKLVYLLQDAFPQRLFALKSRHWSERDTEYEARLGGRAKKWGLSCVASNEVLYHVPERRPLHDLLTCIRHGCTVDTLGTKSRANAEYFLRDSPSFRRLYADDLSAVERTLCIAEQCHYSLDELRYRYPSERLPNGMTSIDWLRTLTFKGARQRYGELLSDDVVRQLERELVLISELDYCGYFLTMYEIVQFCQREGILCQGRGSAANSAVCYCLGITAIDPVRMNLLFERFISKERAEPPDIDLDIAHQRREEVIQHVYDKYGRNYAAMVANVIRYRPRSAVREVGKALGLAETSLDRLAKLLHNRDTLCEETLIQAGFDPRHAGHRHLLELSREILDFPRHLSIHPGGFLLGHQPVCELVPIENGTMAGRTVIQWDKYDVEALGLFKVDLLGLGALSMLDRCFQLLKVHRDIDLEMATIPPDDTQTWDLMCRADTVGVFQIESRAQMSMLPRLRPRQFYDLVIEISIVRPGPIVGEMVHPYLKRRLGEEPVVYPHPNLETVLRKTLGVPLFQEQVMQLAMVAADYTPGEADQLRRDMAAWKREGQLEKHRERLIGRMQKKGISEEFAERIYQQILGFGSYGFPESHAASFALIAYATAYLRAHFITEFTCALLNAQPMGFYAPHTIINDAKRHGARIHPIDVCHSMWDSTLEPGPADLKAAAGTINPSRNRLNRAGDHSVSGTIRRQPPHVQAPRAGATTSLGPHPAGSLGLRLGLRLIKGFSQADAQAIVDARQAQAFKDLDDFVRRTGLAEDMLYRLAEADALQSFGRTRRKALWALGALIRRRKDALKLTPREEQPSFGQLSLLEHIRWDYQSASVSIHGHPLEPFRPALRQKGLPTAADIARAPHQTRLSYVGVVICRQRPGTASGTVFMTLEDETGFVNLILWPKIYAQYKIIAKTAQVLGVTGEIQSAERVVHLLVERLWWPQLSRDLSDCPPQSRDFH